MVVDRYKMAIGGIVLASGASKNLLRRPPLGPWLGSYVPGRRCLVVDRYKMVIGGIVFASGASKNLLRRPPLAGQLTVIKWL